MAWAQATVAQIRHQKHTQQKKTQNVVKVNCCESKDTTRKVKRPNRRKPANQMKGLLSKIYRELLRLKTNSPVKNEQVT